MRGKTFINSIIKKYSLSKTDFIKNERKKNNYLNPLDNLKIAKYKDFGDYSLRRKELLDKGLMRFKKYVENWRIRF